MGTTTPQTVSKAVGSTKLVSSKEAHKQYQNNEDALIVELIEALQAIDTTSSLAKLNATSITDNNGGRILL